MKHKKDIKQSVKMKRLTTRLVGCVFCSAVLVILSITSSVGMKNSLNNQNTLTRYINQYRLASKTLTYAVQSFAVTGGDRFYDDYMTELETDKNREVALAGMEKIGLVPEENKIIDEIAGLSNGLVPLEEKAFEEGKKGKLTIAMESVFGEEYEGTVEEINALSDELISNIGIRIQSLVDIKENTFMIFQALMITSFVIIILEIVAFVRFSFMELLRPIMEVEKQMTSLAAGDLSKEFNLAENESEVGKMIGSIHFMKSNLNDMIHEISYVLNEMANDNFNLKVEKDYIGEYSHIRESLQKIIGEMNNTLHMVQESAEHVSQGSETLSRAAVDLAEGSSNQAALVEELVASMATIEENIRHSTDSAKNSENLSSDAEASLMDGNQRMKELILAINEISDRSMQIGGIIDTINGIAAQTNLLALNAAIEAARAGESGKGFSVVADQVKLLAGASAKATGNITELITATVDAVNKGIGIADLTAKDLEQVISKAKNSTEMTLNIAQALNKEMLVISEVNSAINQVAIVVESNSSTAEETAAASQEQNAQAEILFHMVDKFHLLGNHNLRG